MKFKGATQKLTVGRDDILLCLPIDANFLATGKPIRIPVARKF